MDARVSAAGIPSDPYAAEPLRCAIDQSTASVPPAEQFDFFRTWYAGVAEMQLLRAEQPLFPAHHQVWQLGDLALGTIEVPGSGYDIRWEHRKRPLLDHWVLSAPVARSRGGKMPPGKPRLRCLALPDVAVTHDDLTVTLFLPRTWPATRSSKIEASDATLAFLAHYAILLYRSLPNLREGDLPHVVTATANLFAAALTPSKDHLAAAQGPVDAVTIARIAKTIVERLTDPDLTPAKLCRAAGISRSRLYRIFEPAGGVANYVRRKRLLKTRDALANSSDRRTISSIAEAWGFTDPSTYSRMFKLEFGVSPKEARELGWQGIKHSTWLSIDQPLDGVGTLGTLLINNSLGLSLSSKR
ncbi:MULTISPECIES: helix-turn-helix domain-containing protein [unclassified Mesorhizobium]|uniref:helix-turn-helix domain-containing protein n=1 Tax=unclassified Mesorhizobium TaxID=325217 RepID=UPI00112D10AC|nr:MULTISPECIES: helix-turn-helix domain-containing protein [unclassified Mesorhizobium]TPM93785.1 helix-turn-helix domain-containing protein [Mesorhizobium sp. B2-1-3A]BCG90072.1 AraC family transcriptional regulator [Mesorhizobium sp. 113-3-9]